MYRERLWPNTINFVVCLLLIPAGILALAPFNLVAGIIAGIALAAGAIVFLVVTSPVLEVTETTFRAGRARIDRAFLGEPVAFVGEQARQERGPGLDARAWLCLRGWMPDVVKVPLNDPQDPTPYWLVSTRNPEALRLALASEN